MFKVEQGAVGIAGISHRVIGQDEFPQVPAQKASRGVWRKVKVPGHAEEVLAAARALE